MTQKGGAHKGKQVRANRGSKRKNAKKKKDTVSQEVAEQGLDTSQQSSYIKELGELHEKKKAILEHQVYNKRYLKQFSESSSRQRAIIESDLGFFKLDWDKIAYTKEGREIVLRNLLEADQTSGELTEEEDKIVQTILEYLKSYYLLLKEDDSIIKKGDREAARRNVVQQEGYLQSILSYLRRRWSQENASIIHSYEFTSKNIPITIRIQNKYGEFVPIYDLNIAKISKHTEFFLEKIRKELIYEVNLGIVDITDVKKKGVVEEKFSNTIVNLINRYFPDIDEETVDFLTTYLIQKSLGLGKIEMLMDDPHLEEIAINSSEEPVWVYHKQYAWLKTTIWIENEEQIRHYATMIGRKVGRQITVLEPLMDASLNAGDRVNATLMPVSTRGNTITIRKSASQPWTITDFLRTGTITPETTALIWLALQYELSFLIAGGTASGKTSMLNALASLLPPNQRVLSIEDTRELMLPKFLHWVPMNTKVANAEGKGEVSMLDLLVNALRQRPDRILVGEIRRKKEAEVMFEAMHTGHSVYATVHANTVEDAINRLTNPPIEIPRLMLPAISMVVVQFRNRRTGKRRTFQVAEIDKEGSGQVIYQYDPKKDTQVKKRRSSTLMNTIKLFTGLTDKEINDSLNTKVRVLNWLVRQNVTDVDSIGRIVAEYYTNPDHLLSYVNADKPFE